MGDTGFYARAADAIRSTLVLVSEAADAVQRAGFFARLANSKDEADASAVEAHLTAVWAAVSARRAQRETAVYGEAVRRTVAEIASAYASAKEAEKSMGPDAATDDPLASTEEGTGDRAAASSRTAFDTLLDTLISVAQERRDGVTDDASHAADDGYLALAESLSVLTEARAAYREVADALIAVSEAQDVYRREVGLDLQTALAADIQADLAAEAQSALISDVRDALADLRVVRSAYNATVTNVVWDHLAEVRIAFAEATATLREVQTAFDVHRGDHDPYAASALLAAFGHPEKTSPGAYDAAVDVVAEVTHDLFRCKAAYKAVERIMAEVRAVAADALIEARAAVGAEALIEARAAYDMASSALDALVAARRASEKGLILATPDVVQSRG